MADARGNCDAVPMGMGACTDMDPGASGIIWHETKTSLQNSQEFIGVTCGFLLTA